jgi:hypothetical protein
VLKTAFSCLTWICVCPRVLIPCAGNTIPDQLSFIREQNVMQSVYVAVVAAIHKMVHGWRDLSVGGVLFRVDTGRNHQGAKFSIPVSLLHESSWKFCVYLGFVALLPNIIFFTPSLLTLCISCGKEPVTLRVPTTF